MPVIGCLIVVETYDAEFFLCLNAIYNVNRKSGLTLINIREQCRTAYDEITSEFHVYYLIHSLIHAFIHSAYICGVPTMYQERDKSRK